MVDREIRGIIKQFIETLTSRGIRVEKAVLYGSYASGNVHADSDIDIAVISLILDRTGLKNERFLCR